MVKSTWSVIVVYENAEARESAVAFCDRLVERFWADFGFDVNWCAYESLHDRTKADEAAVKAGEADLIVVAHKTRRDLPGIVKVWTETWLTLRGEHEGTLVGLADLEPENKASACHSYLRQVAHRAGMDFVTELPQSIDTIPDSPETLADRAKQVTSVLDGILHQPSPAQFSSTFRGRS
jgi:hypothetical protein